MGVPPLVRNTLLSLTLLAHLAFSTDASGQLTGTNRLHRNLLEQRSRTIDSLKQELRRVGDWCHANGMAQAAADVTQLTLDLTLSGTDVEPPRLVTLPISPTLPETERHWRQRVQRLREEHAAKLYSLARKALRAGSASIAYRLVEDVLRINPDHAQARSVIGQREFIDPQRDDDGTYVGEWVSVYEAEKRGGRKPHVRHELYGWIPRADVERYEQGLRPWRGEWISQEKEAEIRRDFRYAWEIESEHFLVRTNVSLEEGVLLSRRLETYYSWLRQNFAAFFETPKELRDRFEQAYVRRRRRRTKPQMEVVYYATREEYQKRVRGKVPPEIETNGLYWQQDSTCYFFKNEQRPGFDTLFHEATHQILDIPTRQTRHTAARALARKTGRPVQRWDLGGRSGFWLIEGLACYFESFNVTEGAISVGSPDHIRVVAARQRLLRDGFYVPLGTFCRMGKDQFQHHPNVKQLYSQASGVAHFLMHYDDGRYRDDLVRLLFALYQPNVQDPLSQPNLSDITGVPFENLDQQYRDHMDEIARQP